MNRPRRIEPYERLEIKVPPATLARIDLLLFSEVAGRVPYGARADFILALVKKFFDDAVLDLGPYLGTPPGVYCVSGYKPTIAALERHLQGETK